MPTPRPSPALNTQLVHARAWLRRAARLRLRHPDWADEAVAETLLAALERPPAFDDPPRVRAWLFGILRHKVVDQLRQRGHELMLQGEPPPAEEQAVHADPAERAADRQFILALEGALSTLPALQARAFLLREASGLATDEICAELGVTPGHLWVLLHRGRRRLQAELMSHRV